MAESIPTVDNSADSHIFTEVVATKDPSSNKDKSNKSGYIKAEVIFVNPNDIDSDGKPDIITVGGEYDENGNETDGDVISINTDQISSKQEGDTTSKMTVVLNNNNQKYSGKLTPQATMVYSYIDVERNVVDEKSLTVIHEKFPLFFGRVQEVNMDEQTCTVECGDESSTLEGSVEFDINWFPDVPAKERVEDVLKALGVNVNLKVEQYVAEDKVHDLIMEGSTNSAESGASNISAGVTKPMGLDWEVPSDQLQRLIIMDSSYQTGDEDIDVTDFVLVPVDNESVVGHINVAVVIGDSTKPEDTQDKNTVSSDSAKTTPVEAVDQESIDKYGRIEAPRRSCPWLSMKEANQFAINLIDMYKSYENRLLTPTIVSRIPMLNSRLHYRMQGYTYPENYKTSFNWKQSKLTDAVARTLDLKVLRKKVKYDVGGVLSDLECKRYWKEETPGTKVPDEWERKYKDIGEPGIDYALYAYNDKTGEVIVNYNASTAEYEAFILEGNWPSDPENWNHEHTGPTPFTYFTPTGETYVGHLVGWHL